MHTPEWPMLLCLWELPLAKPSLPAEALGQSTLSLQKYLEPPSRGLLTAAPPALSGPY